MRKIREVLRLSYEMGLSHRQISASLKISRAAIADYLARAQIVAIQWPLAEDMDDKTLEALLFPSVVMAPNKRLPEPDWKVVFRDMQKKGATLLVLHSEYLEQHPDGMSYSHFTNGYRTFKATLKNYMRNVHIAGEKVFVDYAGKTMEIHDHVSRQSRTAQIFVGVLGASNLIYADATWNQKKENWIASHVRMFETFGGVPRMVVCDNLKSGVIKASRTEPILNASYEDMANHYKLAVFPARSRKPKDKAKAEGGVLIVSRWILFRLRNHIFTSLEELNLRIGELLRDINNRPFQKLPGSRMSMFLSQEKPALKQLPLHPYTYREFRKVRAGFDYHVELDGHYYSVPHELANKELEAILTAAVVEIQYAGRRVASHAREYVAGKSTIELHMVPAHKHFANFNPDTALNWALLVGVNTHAFLEKLFANSTHRDFSYRYTNALKSMGRMFGEDRLELACKRGMEIGAEKTSTIKSILKNNMDRLSSVVSSGEEPLFDHDNIRGPNYYH